jgi:hypothetical protein
MPDVTLRLLSAAAERRGISAQELALRILIGAVHKDSIDKAANFYLDVGHPDVCARDLQGENVCVTADDPAPALPLRRRPV